MCRRSPTSPRCCVWWPIRLRAARPCVSSRAPDGRSGPPICGRSLSAPRSLEIRGGYGTAGRVDDPQALDAALGSALPGEQSEQAGLADAIADPGSAERYSEAGHRRITALAGELHLLRDRIGQPLTELVADIERIMGIGVEAQARTPFGVDGAVGREHLDEFAHVVADYADNPTATVTGFLSFLAAAETVEDGLAPGRSMSPRIEYRC